MPLFKASNGGFWNVEEMGGFYLSQPPIPGRTPVPILRKVRHEAFPNGTPSPSYIPPADLAKQLQKSKVQNWRLRRDESSHTKD